ncbi:hypothetical protein [Salimicrobium halophilum]|uniref:Ig-like domain-containing protein n=1 Tax=Salimicrobium halophilum TaxID=86666 RepID=A0A1G8WSZ8_9BACI|nr:hypothetical protein [Salimicrobium halophilum]SDJ81499.1 hypothetical protein SAMN04490247_3313 [Salimicrobium halophilum]
MKKWILFVSIWIMMSGFAPEMSEDWSYSCDTGESEEVFSEKDRYIVVCGTAGVPEEVVSLSPQGEVEWTHDVKGVVQPVFEKNGERLWMVSEAREEGLDYIVDMATGESDASVTFDFPSDILINDRTFMKAANGKLHVFAGENWYAMEQTGERAFTFTGNEQLLPDLSVDKDSYYVADDGAFSEDPNIYKVDEEGEVLWKKRAALDELPLFTDDYVWFTEPFQGTFHTVDPYSGDTISEQEGDFYHRLLLKQPLMMENHLFTSSELYQLSVDGEVEWKTEVSPYRLEEYIDDNDLEGDQWLLQERTIASRETFRLFSQNVYFYNEQNKEIAALVKLYDDGSFAWTNRELPKIDYTEVVNDAIVAAGEGYVSSLNQNGEITDSHPVNGEVKQLLKEDAGVLTVTSDAIARLSVTSGEAGETEDYLPVSSQAMDEKQTVDRSKVWHVQFNTAISPETAVKNIAVVNENGEAMRVDKTFSEDGKEMKIRPPQGGYEAGTYAITVHDRIASPEGKLLEEEVYQMFDVD